MRYRQARNWAWGIYCGICLLAVLGLFIAWLAQGNR